MPRSADHAVTPVEIPAGKVVLNGELALPAEAKGIVLFAHGSGSSRHSPRNQFVAGALHEYGIGTLLFDLLTAREEAEDSHTNHLRFDIKLLAQRLAGATAWVHAHEPAQAKGYFGASTGAAAALLATVLTEVPIVAVVSRGGRPDLTGPLLGQVRAPTLLIVGSNDTEVIEMNRQAYVQMNCAKDLRLVPGATHLFEEPGTLEAAAALAGDWFARHFDRPLLG